MAITIHQLPQVLMPVYNPVITVASSTNQTKEGFQFVFDVYPKASSTKIARVKFPPNPAGYGIFDTHRILENYLDYDFNPDLTGFTQANSSKYQYEIKIGEEYNYIYESTGNFSTGGLVTFSSSTTPHYFSAGSRVIITMNSSGNTYPQYNGIHTVISSLTSYNFCIEVPYAGTTPALEASTSIFADYRKTQFLSLTATTGFTVNNAAFSHLDFSDYDFNDHIVGQFSFGGGFSTDMPQSGWEVREDSRILLNGYLDAPAINSTILCNVNVMDENGSLSQYIISGFPGGYNYMQLGIGPWNLNNANKTIITGSSQVIKSSTTYYEFYTTDVSGFFPSKTYRIYLDPSPTKYDSIQLMFMDRKGSFNCFSFTMQSKESVRIARQEFKKNIGTFALGIGWGYTPQQRGRTIFNTDIQRKYKATSNWVTGDANVQYLEQLFTSNEVYWVKDGVALPVIITSDDFNVKKGVNDKIMNFDIEFEMAYNETIQRG